MSAENINPFLRMDQCYCLNEDAISPLNNLFLQDLSVLRSNADEQLIIHLVFKETVKLDRLMLVLPLDAPNCPNELHLFANMRDIGFDDAPGWQLVI